MKVIKKADERTGLIRYQYEAWRTQQCYDSCTVVQRRETRDFEDANFLHFHYLVRCPTTKETQLEGQDDVVDADDCWDR